VSIIGLAIYFSVVVYVCLYFSSPPRGSPQLWWIRARWWFRHEGGGSARARAGVHMPRPPRRQSGAIPPVERLCALHTLRTTLLIALPPLGVLIAKLSNTLHAFVFLWQWIILPWIRTPTCKYIEMIKLLRMPRLYYKICKTLKIISFIFIGIFIIKFL
jgi:hypothetical protein